MPPEVLAAVEAHKKEKMLVLQARGVLMARTEDLSQLLDLLIRLYFSVPNDKAFRFEGLLLRRLAFAGKLECLRGIVTAGPAAEDPDVRTLLEDLQEIRRYRNFTAHSTIEDLMNPILDRSHDMPVVARWRRANGKRAHQQLTAADVIDKVRLVADSESRLRAIAVCIAGDEARELRPGAMNDWLNQDPEDGIPTVPIAFLDALIPAGPLPDDFEGPRPEDFDADLGY